MFISEEISLVLSITLKFQHSDYSVCFVNIKIQFLSNFNSLTLGSFSNLVLLKLNTVLYPNLAYAKSFAEKFWSLKQILCKV